MIVYLEYSNSTINLVFQMTKATKDSEPYVHLCVRFCL